MRIVVLVVIAGLLLGFAANILAEEAKDSGDVAAADMPQAMFKNYQDLKWDKILPELGDDSPEMCILRVDPKTKATQLLIRTPTAIHARKHWHSANEMHVMMIGTQQFACEGKRVEQSPGSFNYMPAKMVHEVWSPAGALIFISLDGPWDIHWVEGAPTAADLSK